MLTRWRGFCDSDQMYLFLHRPQNNLKLEGFHLNGDKVPFQNTLPNLFVSVQATKEWKIERPEWQPRVFSEVAVHLLIKHLLITFLVHLLIEIRTSVHRNMDICSWNLDICSSNFGHLLLSYKKVKVGLQEKVIRFGRVIFPFLRNRNQERRVQKKCVTPATQLWKVKVCPKKLMRWYWRKTVLQS